jgi:hypothetical protein
MRHSGSLLAVSTRHSGDAANNALNRIALETQRLNRRSLPFIDAIK